MLAPVKGDLPKVKIGNNQELVFPESLHNFCLQGEQRYGNKYTVGQEQQIGSWNNLTTEERTSDLKLLQWMKSNVLFKTGIA